MKELKQKATTSGNIVTYLVGNGNSSAPRGHLCFFFSLSLFIFIHILLAAAVAGE